MSELKPEVILTFLGLEAKTEEEFKTSFENKFGIKDQLLKDPKFIGDIFGKRIGSIESRIISNTRKMGIEFPGADIKDKGVEDIIDMSFMRIADMNKKAMEDLEKASKGTVDEQVKAAKEEAKQLREKLKDTEGLLSKTSTDFEGFKKEQVNKSKFDTINGFKKTAIGKLEFKQDISPVEKMGFETVLDSKYEFDLDETSNPFIKDKKTGTRIPSKKTIGQFMTTDEILQEELISNKLAKINAQGGKPAPKYGQSSLPAEDAGKKNLYIHPAARAAAGM